MKIKQIVVTVEFRTGDAESSVRQSCAIDASDVNKIRVADLTDACQRAAAHCIDELEKHLDK